jgi:hypothetical protein
MRAVPLYPPQVMDCDLVVEEGLEELRALALKGRPYTLHPKPYTLHPTPQTPNPTP